MGNLPVKFEKAVDVPAFEQVQAVRAAERAKIAEERQNDHDLGVAGKEADAGRIATGTTENRTQEVMARREEQERRNRTDTQILLSASMSLPDFERGLESEYGVDFDLDLFADLVEDGHFTQKEYEQFASIQDPEERRRAIASAIQDKIDAGEIDPADLADHPWAMEWLSKHEEARAEQKLEAEMGLSGQKAIAEVSVGGQEVIGDSTSRQSDIDEVDRMAENDMTSVASNRGFSLNLG